MATGYSELRNELVSAANGVDYAYRDTGGGGAPLVLLLGGLTTAATFRPTRSRLVS
jgi:pimeloyl-ACP methyl ester carboxylesterase